MKGDVPSRKTASTWRRGKGVRRGLALACVISGCLASCAAERRNVPGEGLTGPCGGIPFAHSLKHSVIAWSCSDGSIAVSNLDGSSIGRPIPKAYLLQYNWIEELPHTLLVSRFVSEAQGRPGPEVWTFDLLARTKRVRLVKAPPGLVLESMLASPLNDCLIVGSYPDPTHRRELLLFDYSNSWQEKHVDLSRPALRVQLTEADSNDYAVGARSQVTCIKRDDGEIALYISELKSPEPQLSFELAEYTRHGRKVLLTSERYVYFYHGRGAPILATVNRSDSYELYRDGRLEPLSPPHSGKWFVYDRADRGGLTIDSEPQLPIDNSRTTLCESNSAKENFNCSVVIRESPQPRSAGPSGSGHIIFASRAYPPGQQLNFQQVYIAYFPKPSR